MQESSRTRNTLIGAALVCIVFLLVYGLFLREVFKVNSAVAMLEGGVGEQEEQEEHLRTVRNVLLRTETERADLETRFIEEEGIVTFIEQIEELGRLSDVALDITSVEIKPVEGEEEVTYEWLLLSVEADGTWQGVYRLFTLIESLPVALFLNTVRINLENEDDDVWRGEFSVRVAKWKAQ